MSTEEIGYLLDNMDDIKLAVYTVVGGLFLLVGMFIVFIFFMSLKN